MMKILTNSKNQKNISRNRLPQLKPMGLIYVMSEEITIIGADCWLGVLPAGRIQRKNAYSMSMYGIDRPPQ